MGPDAGQSYGKLFLPVLNQVHEAEVHVKLSMTVKQR